MLLSFLDRGEYERMGRYGKPSRADVRIVGATNSDLRARSLKDEFRLDLWYRLAVSVVEVPPLRERFADVTAYLRTRALRSGGTLWDALTDDAVGVLEAHTWEGNFRELANFALRITPLARGRAIDAARCRAALAEGAIGPISTPAPRGESARPPASPDAMHRAFAVAAHAFEEDRGGPMPESWDDVKDFVENYVKPVLFAQLAGAEDAPSAGDVDLRAASQKLKADRGTAARQLDRFFDRFKGTRGP
jgi:DNA-binding NtrC family response regulator